MKKSRLLGTVCASLVALSFNANAIIVDNGNYTTVNGLDWLDLTETANMSYSAVSMQLGAGGLFEGWTYATRAQVSDFWDAFGGDSNFYGGYSTQNNGLFSQVAQKWGDLFCEIKSTCTVGTGYSYILTADVESSGRRWTSQAYDYYADTRSPTEDYMSISSGSSTTTYTRQEQGSALVRVSAVPVPGAVWLFGTGLLGLIRVARHKKTA